MYLLTAVIGMQYELLHFGFTNDGRKLFWKVVIFFFQV